MKTIKLIIKMLKTPIDAYKTLNENVRIAKENVKKVQAMVDGMKEDRRIREAYWAKEIAAGRPIGIRNKGEDS